MLATALLSATLVLVMLFYAHKRSLRTTMMSFLVHRTSLQEFMQMLQLDATTRYQKWLPIVVYAVASIYILAVLPNTGLGLALLWATLIVCLWIDPDIARMREDSRALNYWLNNHIHDFESISMGRAAYAPGKKEVLVSSGKDWVSVNAEDGDQTLNRFYNRASLNYWRLKSFIKKTRKPHG